MSHETVEERQEHSGVFSDMSVQEVLLYADLAECSTIERRTVQYYLEGMSHSQIAQEFNSHVDFVALTLEVINTKLRDQKSKVDESKRGQLLHVAASGEPTFLPVESLTDVAQKRVPSSLRKASSTALEVASLSINEPRDWRLQAACRPSNSEEGVAPDVFYPGEKNNRGIQAAKAICKRCVVWQECLQTALDNDEEFGVWGGMSPLERKRSKVKRRK